MSAAKRKFVIEVTGDLVQDSNLAQLPLESCSYSKPVQTASRKPRNGGAWYLADLLEISCRDLNKKCDLIHPHTDLDCAQAHTVWTAFEKKQEKGNKEYVWRIREFLGCQKPKVSEEDSSQNNETTVADAETHPSMVVIDDANLGFRDDESLWPTAIRTYDEEKNLEVDRNLKIVLKHSPLLAQGALWKCLIENFADQLTVVISLNALRDRHAVISKGISWDQTIEDLKKEFRIGASAFDLGLARNVIVLIPGGGVACFTRKKSKKDEKPVRTQLKHLVFDPDHMEDDWKPIYPGKTFGACSILTAVMVRHLQQPGTYPFFIAASRALIAIRENHIIGSGPFDPKNSDEPFTDFKTDAAHDAIEAILHPVPNTTPKPVYAEEHFAAVLLNPESYGLKNEDQQSNKRKVSSKVNSADEVDLLQDVTGHSKGSLAAKAFEIVRDGVDAALCCVPKAKYGNFVTVDREEIERINELRSMIETYCNNPADRKPLSLAVFGPPGSGKSFAIKQLAKQLFPKNPSPLEFNLSQFADRHELNEAFHQVHNATVRGEIPFVFWDEFDTEKLDWLKNFLAPMQDAVFRDAGIEHPFGKAIFIFAGGTCKSFDEFDRSESTTEEEEQFFNEYNASFKDLKGPDFISRLRGYLNVKGPNKIQDEKSEHVYLIRRAMLLRSLLERNAPEIIDPGTKMASISTGIINAFIHVDEYRHGARSMEAVITMGTVRGKRFYGPNSLPSPRLLDLHVTDDFWKEKIDEGAMELMAKAGHDGWKEDKADKGYSHGEQRNDDPTKGPLKHPLFKEYSELEEKDKRGNRQPIPYRMIALEKGGYPLSHTPTTTPGKHSVDFSKNKTLLDHLKAEEHHVWLRNHLVNGWELASETNDRLRQHTDIQPFEDLKDEQKQINEAIILKTIKELQNAGYL